MKDQYFGDINDYRKYGLLRVLLGARQEDQQEAFVTRLLVAWMLTPNDDSNDGGKRGYLKDPKKYKKYKEYDPKLFEGLENVLIHQGREPSVSLIEGTDLLPNTTYYSEMVPDTCEGRRKWREGLLKAAEDADLVFLDPDNGIEVSSRPIGHRLSPKYIYWNEIKELWDGGKSLLIYQHFGRERRACFARRMVCELGKQTDAPSVAGFATADVLFLLALQEEDKGKHEEKFNKISSSLKKEWESQFCLAAVSYREGRELYCREYE